MGIHRPVDSSIMAGMNRIKELRDERGLTQDELGELMGTTGATVQRLETSKRGLSQKWLEAAAKALGVHIYEILEQKPPDWEGIPVIGKVQGGNWREVDEDVTDTRKVPVRNDPRYITLRQYALEVLGDSMDKVFPGGQFIVCVPWADTGRALKHGDLVVAERQKNDHVEATVKRVRVVNGKILLMPESTNPRFQKPLPLDDGDSHEEVKVTGLVIGRYEPL